MLSKKEVRLVDYLLAKQGQFVSSAELAKALGVSDRTARKYAQQLSLSLEASGASILSKQSKGYCLQVERPVEFEIFWQEQLRLKKQVTDLRQLEEATDRQRYVLSKLLFENPIQSMDHLQRELFIGKTTLHSIIADIRKLFVTYQLELLFTRRGVELSGEEPAIRHFIMDYFFGQGAGHSPYGLVENQLLPDIRFTDLMLIVLEECRDAKLRLSDFVMQNLVLHLTPVITVSVFLSEQDIEAIRAYLQQVTPVRVEQFETLPMEEEQARQIAEAVFSPFRIVSLDKKMSRDRVLLQLIRCLNEAQESGFVEHFREQVNVRESYSSVVFGELLAFPHPAIPLTFSEQIVHQYDGLWSDEWR